MEQIAKMQRPVWDYLFYLSMLVLTVWLILKVAGYIKTPVWLEYGVPLGSLIIGFLTFFQSIVDKFSKLTDKVSDLQVSHARMEGVLVHHDRDLERIKDQLIQ